VTYFEKILVDAVNKNSTLLGVSHAEVVSISGPLRLGNETFEGIANLAMTALGGFSTKEVAKAVVPAAPANFNVVPTAANKAVGLIIRVAGSRNTFKQGPVILTVTGTGMSSTKFAIYPHSNEASIMVLLCNDNGGVGAISAPTAINVAWLVAEHPEAAGLEYVISAELITLRDFTRRERTNGR
jgi:hypothetical protein